jgi:hypothetical protein
LSSFIHILRRQKINESASDFDAGQDFLYQVLEGGLLAASIEHLKAQQVPPQDQGPHRGGHHGRGTSRHGRAGRRRQPQEDQLIDPVEEGLKMLQEAINVGRLKDGIHGLADDWLKPDYIDNLRDAAKHTVIPFIPTPLPQGFTTAKKKEHQAREQEAYDQKLALVSDRVFENAILMLT